MMKKYPIIPARRNASFYLKFRKYFNVEQLWTKVTKVAKTAGIKAIYAVLLLYQVSIDSSTPWKAKAVIYGALGYFIFPADLIPDALPLVGYSDDLTALTAALKTVYNYITPAIHEKAFVKLKKWFPDVTHEEVKKLI